MKESTKTATKVAKNETKATAKATETATAKNQVKEVKELKEDKAMQEVKEMEENVTATTETTTSKTSKEVKEMKDTKTLEQKLQELEDAKKALKEQLNEQKRAERLEAQVKDKVANLLERFARIGVQLVANADAIYKGADEDNSELHYISLKLNDCMVDLVPVFARYEIDLDELRLNVKPLATAKTERTQRPHRTLSELGVKDGATVVHISSGNEYIVSNDKILYNDKETSLSKVASILKNGQSRSGFRDFRLKDCSECLADMPSIM